MIRFMLAVAISALLLFANTVTASAAVSVGKLNELINLLRLNTGVMEGPLEYAYVNTEGYKTKVRLEKMKKGSVLRIDIVEIVGHVVKAGNTESRRMTPYVAVYEDDGPDGVLDKVTVKYIWKSHKKQFGRLISTKTTENQAAYDVILSNIISYLKTIRVT